MLERCDDPSARVVIADCLDAAMLSAGLRLPNSTLERLGLSTNHM